MNSTPSECSDTISNHSLTLTDSLNGDLLNNNTNNQQQNNLDPQTYAKYDKLIQDFVKLRSKLTILKKAYVELSEQSTHKDKTIRKNEQELEGLNFRNQQLTSRVENLQKELDSFKALPASTISPNQLTNPNPTTFSNGHTIPSNQVSFTKETSNGQGNYLAVEVLEDELKHKINENASLHKRIHEIETNYEQALTKCQFQLNSAETEKLSLSKKLAEIEMNSKSCIEKLQNDKIKLEVTLSHRDSEIRNMKIRIFGENSLNDSVEQPAVPDLDKFLQTVSLQADCLANVYSKLDERNEHLQPDDVRSTASVFSQCEKMLLKEIVPLVMQCDLSRKSELDNLLVGFSSCNKKVFQQLASGLTTEHPSANDEIKLLNKKLKLQLNLLVGQLFDTFDNSIELEQLKKFSESSATSTPKSVPLFTLVTELLGRCVGVKNSKSMTLNSEKEMVPSSFNQHFTRATKSIHDTLEKILCILNEKLSVEYSLNYPAPLTMIDECIVSYLTQLKQSLNTLLSLLHTDMGILELATQLATSKSSKIKEDSKLKHANEKINKLQKELDDLERQKFKYEQIRVQLVELQRVEQEQKAMITSLEKEKVEASLTTNQVVQHDSMEDTIKTDYYISKIASLNEQVQELDSRSVFYYEEMKCMLERLHLQMEVNDDLEADLHEVKDQLERTRSSYEIQMSTMSDHLIEITDRMNRQEEDNERLKHDYAMLVNGGKSGKTKKTK